MVRSLFFSLLLPLSPLLAQTAAELFEKAPPDVDEALRSRVKLFYQAHVDGKFRLADQVVAEDSKDAFYEAKKNRCHSFEIVNIKYAENFTRATAVVTCELDFAMPGAGKVRAKAPMTTLWKLENGQWCWYVVPTDTYETPFGVMRPGPDAPSSSAAAANPNPAQASADLARIMQMVKADKREVRLKRNEIGSDEVVLTNHLPSAVSLVLQFSSLPGLEITLDRSELKPGESARLCFRYTPQDKVVVPDSMTAQLMVQPVSQVISVRIVFAR